MRIRCWVRAISSRWTELTSSSCSRARSRSEARTASSSCSRSPRAASTAARASAARWIDTSSLASTTADGDADGLGRAALADQPLAALDRPRPRLALGLGGADQRVGAAVEGAGALLAGAQRQPGVHLGLPGGARRVGEPLALGGVGLLVGGVLRPRSSRLSSSASPARSCSRASWAAAIAWAMPLGLGAGRTRLRAVVAELLGHGGQRGVGLVELGQRDVDPALGVLPLGLEARDVEPEPLGRGDGLGQRGRASSYAAWISSRLGWLCGAAGGEVGAVHVAVAGHRGDVGQVGDQGAGRVEVGDDRGLEEQPGQRRPQGVGALHHVDGVRRVGRAARATARGRRPVRRRAAVRRDRGRRP